MTDRLKNQDELTARRLVDDAGFRPVDAEADARHQAELDKVLGESSLVAHLAGKHNQKAHGRGGSTGGDGKAVGGAPLKSSSGALGSNPTPEEVDAWGEQQAFADWHESLSETEAEGLNMYTAGSYNLWNKSARGTPISRAEVMDQAEGQEYEQVRFDALTNAVARSSLPEDVVTYRGMDFGDPAAAKLRARLEGGATIITDPGFMSTTPSPSSIQRYLDGHMTGRPAADRVVLEIKVPRGSQAAYVSKGKHASYVNERELLLGRGTRLTFSGSRTDDERFPGSTVISATVEEQFARPASLRYNV